MKRLRVGGQGPQRIPDYEYVGCPQAPQGSTPCPAQVMNSILGCHIPRALGSRSVFPLSPQEPGAVQAKTSVYTPLGVPGVACGDVYY